jgi:hypothetical protein
MAGISAYFHFPLLIRRLGKHLLAWIGRVLDAAFGILGGVVVTCALVGAHEGSTANTVSQAAQRQPSEASANSTPSKVEDTELANEITKLKNQLHQKATELDRERQRFSAAINQLRSQREAEGYHLAGSQTRVQNSKEGETDRTNQDATRQEGNPTFANPILSDLAQSNDAKASYRINADGTLVLNKRYLVTGRPISSENYDVNFWASCLIDVKNTGTGETVSRTVFKKGVPQALSIGDVSAKLILSVTPDPSAGCVFAASQ